MKKFIFRFFLYFLLISALILIVNSYFLNQKRYDWGESNSFRKKLTYLQQNPSEYNSVFIGSSKIRHHVKPNQFDRLTHGVRSFNLGSNGMLMPKSLGIAEAILNDTSINLQYMFLEFGFIQGLSANLHSSRSYYWINTTYLIFVIRSIAISNHALERKLTLIYQYLISYCNKYLALGAKSALYTTESMSSELDPYELKNRGYVSLDYQLAVTPTNRLRKVRENFLSDTVELFDFERKYKESISHSNSKNRVFQNKMKDLIDLAGKRGTTLIFVLQSGENMKHIYDTFQEIPLKNKLDLSLEKPLYLAQNHFDFRHLNDKGAGIFTEILSSKFNLLYNNTDTSLDMPVD